jgi:hypothetical protein
MKTKQNSTRWIMKRMLLLVFVAVVLITACTPKVWLDQRDFKPTVKEYAVFKNKDLLVTIYNSASRYYYSDTLRVRYTSFPSLNTYLLAAYQDIFMRAGFVVYQAKPSARIVPELKISISWISDETMVAEAFMSYDEGIRFKKEYTIKMPASKETDTQQELQQKAYRMIAESANAILDDPAFQESYRVMAKTEGL